MNPSHLIKFFIITLFVFSSLWMMVSIAKLLTTQTPDFSVYYYGGQDILYNNNPYESSKGLTDFGYPIATGYLFVPLGLFPYNVAQNFFTLINVLATLGVVGLSVKFVYKNLRLYPFLLFTGLAFLSFPIKFNLGMGQNNMFALLLVLGSYWLYISKRNLLSGILLGSAFLLKPILGLLLLLYLRRRAWKLIATSILFPLSLVLLSIIQFGWNVTFSYFVNMTRNYSNIGSNAAYYNQGLAGLLSRSIDNSTLVRTISRIINIALVISVNVIAYKQKISDQAFLSLVLTLIVIVDLQSWQHHYVFLIFPFMYVARATIQLKGWLLKLLTLLSFLLISFNLKIYPDNFVFPANLILSHALLGAIILFIIQFYLILSNSNPKHNKKATILV